MNVHIKLILKLIQL